VRPLALTVLLLALMGLAGAATGHGVPAEPRTGGTLLDARRVTYAALAGLERRGYVVDRSLLKVRVIPLRWSEFRAGVLSKHREHVCEHYTACAVFNRYTGERTVFLRRELVRESVVILPEKRVATCMAFEIATHEWLHHARTLRETYRNAFDGYRETVRDGYTTDEYDEDHAQIIRLAHAYTAQAERNGNCVAAL
jgi:hypothetical protein